MSSPFVLFLKHAAPGRRFVTMEHSDKTIQSYASRFGVAVSTSRATIITGTHLYPEAESAVVVTIIGRGL